MNTTQLKNIVAFCALMQNEDGIMGKSPDYIEEKFNRYCLSQKEETPWGLDSVRQNILKEWETRWLTKREVQDGGNE